MVGVRQVRCLGMFVTMAVPPLPGLPLHSFFPVTRAFYLVMWDYYRVQSSQRLSVRELSFRQLLKICPP